MLDWGPLSASNLSHYALSLAYPFLSSTQSVLSPSHVSALLDTYSFDFTSHSLAYKPVAKKVRPVLAPLEEEYEAQWVGFNPDTSDTHHVYFADHRVVVVKRNMMFRCHDGIAIGRVGVTSKGENEKANKNCQQIA